MTGVLIDEERANCTCSRCAWCRCRHILDMGFHWDFAELAYEGGGSADSTSGAYSRQARKDYAKGKRL